MATLGEASPGTQAVIALLGGLTAGSTHLTKAGARAAVNTSPEPVSNWVLSLGEDAFVVGLGLVALKYPVAALIVTVLLLLIIVLSAAAIVRAVRRRWGRATHSQWA